MADKQALVDSGATDNFMHLNFAKRMGLGIKALPNPKKIFNIDNTTNKSGMTTHYLDLNVDTKGIHKEMRFLITNIGREEILLGYPWLATFEPRFNWRSATMAPQFMPVIISSINPCITRSLSRFPLALSPKTKRTRSYTSCESTHVTSGVNTRQTPSNLTGIRTMETTAWQLDA
jgi:hypothetical protein